MIRDKKEDNKLTGKRVVNSTKISSEQKNANSEYESTETVIREPQNVVDTVSKTKSNVKKNNIRNVKKNKPTDISTTSKQEKKKNDITVQDTGNPQQIVCGVASLKKCIIAPRKVRMIANMLRGKTLKHVFGILSCNQKKCCSVLRKLLFVALVNYEKNCEKNERRSVSDMGKLLLYKITVDNGGMLKRILPASQGRAFRIRKRFSHISVEIKEC